MHRWFTAHPSDALAAKRTTDRDLSALLLGLGGVALLVGGVGVANTMVISVLERRAEIGLRRALGATRGQIRLQFLAESLLVSLLGGAGGAVLGIAVTAAYATTQHWPTVVPSWATAGGLGATVLIGGIAGLYPAIRAARLAPPRRSRRNSGQAVLPEPPGSTAWTGPVLTSPQPSGRQGPGASRREPDLPGRNLAGAQPMAAP